MKFGQSVCLDEIFYMFENGSRQVQNQVTRSIIEDPMLVTRVCDLNPYSLMLYHTFGKTQVSNSRAVMALLLSESFKLSFFFNFQGEQHE